MRQIPHDFAWDDQKDVVQKKSHHAEPQYQTYSTFPEFGNLKFLHNHIRYIQGKYCSNTKIHYDSICLYDELKVLQARLTPVPVQRETIMFSQTAGAFLEAAQGDELTWRDDG